MKTFLAFFNQPLLKWPILFGLATGVFSFLYFLSLYFLGFVPLGNRKTPDIGITIILMTAAVWYYRRKIGKGLLHLWEAITICYVVNTVGAIINGWLIYFFVTYIDPSVFVRYTDELRQLISSRQGQLVKELGREAYLKLLQGVGEIRTADLITDEISKKTVLVILPVLIISLIFRRQAYSLYNTQPTDTPKS
ncbi:DUF4199 domain-containing protein [Larkinella soli]|uniref:DUF4199 domain-containing protein n=1 Tax=Larkinella soli TaxID=1770527 RepID=UPI000FFC702F|nr:DUF4199 domain-containing protein [Larkinella soli]